MNSEKWIKDPSLKIIPEEKLLFLKDAVFDSMKIFENHSLTKEQYLPYLISIVKKNQNSNIKFSEEETSIIIESLKLYTSPEEQHQFNKLLLLLTKKVCVSRLFSNISVLHYLMLLTF